MRRGRPLSPRVLAPDAAPFVALASWAVALGALVAGGRVPALPTTIAHERHDHRRHRARRRRSGRRRIPRRAGPARAHRRRQPRDRRRARDHRRGDGHRQGRAPGRRHRGVRCDGTADRRRSSTASGRCPRSPCRSIRRRWTTSPRSMSGAVIEAQGTARAPLPGDRAVLDVTASRGVTVQHPPAGPFAVAANLRRGLVAAVRGLPSPGAGLVPGLAVGDTSAVGQQLDTDMKQSSLSHLTAVSGANCALVVGLAFVAAAAAGARRSVRVIVGLVALSRLRAARHSRAQRGPRRDDGRGRDARRAARPHRGGDGDPLARRRAPAGSRSLARRVARDSPSRRWRPHPSCCSPGRSPTGMARVLAAGARARAVGAAGGPTGVRAAARAHRPRRCRYTASSRTCSPSPPHRPRPFVGLAACLAAPVPLLQSGLAALAWVPASWIAATAQTATSLPGDLVPWIEGWPGAALLGIVGVALGAIVVVRPGGRRAARLARGGSMVLVALVVGVAGGGVALDLGRGAMDPAGVMERAGVRCRTGRRGAASVGGRRHAGRHRARARAAHRMPRSRRDRSPRRPRADPLRHGSCRGSGCRAWVAWERVLHGPPYGPARRLLAALSRGRSATRRRAHGCEGRDRSERDGA